MDGGSTGGKIIDGPVVLGDVSIYAIGIEGEFGGVGFTGLSLFDEAI